MTISAPAARPLHALVIAYGFPPNGSIGTMRTLRLVRHLASTGWRVTVLTAEPRDYRPTTPVDPALLERVPAGVKVVRARVIRWFSVLESWLRGLGRSGARPAAQGPSPAASAGADREPGSSTARQAPSLPRRVARTIDALLSVPDQESGWLLPGVAVGLRLLLAGPRVDVIYSSSPPWTGTVTALLVATLGRKPWVADFRDPWSRAPWREDRPPLVVRILAFLERRAVMRADAVTFAPPGVHREFAQFYGPDIAARFQAVPNGCDVSEFADLVATPDPDRFVLLHAGSLYGGRRDPNPLLRAIARALEKGALDRTRFRLRMLGVDAPGAVQALCADYGLSDVVEVLPRVPRRESLQQMVSASALLLIQPGEGALPGKLQEYFAAGRPVLGLVDDPLLVSMLNESGVGIPAPANDAELIEAALSMCVSLAAGGVQRPPRRLYDGAVQAEGMEALLSLTARGGAADPPRGPSPNAEGLTR